MATTQLTVAVCVCTMSEHGEEDRHYGEIDFQLPFSLLSFLL